MTYGNAFALFLCLTVFFVAAPAAAQSPPDAERGRRLYENHCQACHTSRVHSRANRLPMNQTELREIVDRWQGEEKLRWSAQDIGDVVEYLNRTLYGYSNTTR
jgi:mono/diheme cytochrome c family protein